jgi:hypothetical protein
VDTGNDNFTNDKQFELIKKATGAAREYKATGRQETSLEHQLLLHPIDFFLYPQHL